MIDVKEHEYADDPAVGHPDVRTRLSDACYYFLGNGRIQAAVQVAPGGEGSAYGLIVQDPARLTAKRDSLTFDPSTGLERTMITIVDAAGETVGRPSTVAARWVDVQGVPVVEVSWEAWPVGVEERLYCPDRQQPHLLRAVRLFNRSNNRLEIGIRTGVRDAVIDVPFSMCPGGSASVDLRYALERVEEAAPASWRVALTRCPPAAPSADALAHAAEQTRVATGHAVLDHLFESAAEQLTAAISDAGRVDASIWQYTREWVRDHSFMASGLLLSGHHAQARAMLDRLLRDFVADSGAAYDSSELREADESELDQNGILLIVLAQYLWWTGDESLARDQWAKIEAVAEFPLSSVFRHVPSGLLANRRDFWERHSAHGLEPGLELAHQFFVVLGLEAAAAIAGRLRRPGQAERWLAAAARLRHAVLQHPVFRLVDGDHLIKRRGLDGRTQDRIDPRPHASLPAGVGLAGPPPHALDPDSVTACAVAWGFLDPGSPLAAGTMREVERLWNQCWSDGGYARYHVGSDPDSPGAWPFVGGYIARAYVEMGRHDAAWRVLEWLGQCPGSASGAWFEMHGPRIAPPYSQVGIVPWAWAELILLFIHHLLGVRPGPRGVLVRPRPLLGLKDVTARVRVRGATLSMRVVLEAGRQTREIRTALPVLGRIGDGFLLEYPAQDEEMLIQIPEEQGGA